MPAIDPDTDEKAEVGPDDNRVEIVEGFRGLDDGISGKLKSLRGRGTGTYCKEEITDVVRDIDGNAHVCEVESIAQTDER